MDLGIGLPNAVPGATGKQMTEFARAADEAGFSTLGTIDRVAYGNHEPIVSLAAAAAVTDRIRLATTVLLGPLRQNAPQLAKQVLSIDSLAGGGRTILGIAIGGREDDYGVSGVEMSERGDWMDDSLGRIRDILNGDGEGDDGKVGPEPVGDGPTLIVGGGVKASFERAARYGAGWIQGGAGPEAFGEDAKKLDEAWKAEGRDGEPRKLALGYFSLGPDAEKHAQGYLTDYYAWLGDETARMIAGSAATDPGTVKQYLSAFEGNGCDELILFPSSADSEQVTLLAEAAGI